VVVRRVEAEDLRAPVAVAAFGGAVAGITFGLLTSLATGSAGPGRMAVIGPQILLTTVVIGVGMAAGAVIGGVVYLGLEDRLAARADRARHTSR
jgi:hypothetical protein